MITYLLLGKYSQQPPRCHQLVMRYMRIYCINNKLLCNVIPSRHTGREDAASAKGRAWSE